MMAPFFGKSGKKERASGREARHGQCTVRRSASFIHSWPLPPRHDWCGAEWPLRLGVAGLPCRRCRRQEEAQKKEKKKCKGGAKKCGKKCIPATGCCSASECGQQGICVNNTCQCNNGFKDCNGECIQNNACCDNCPGDLVCDSGACICPEDAPFDCPGNVCVSGGQCCDDNECSIDQACVDGICLCPGPDEITCGDLCCDQTDEICKVDDENPSACQAGECPTTDFCTDPDLYLCANDLEQSCGCATTTDAVNACIDLNASIDCNNDCVNDDDCALDEVCIPGNEAFCACPDNFCAPVCGAGVLRHTARNSGSSLLDVRGGKRTIGKRRGR